jgi:hypothetical protein
MMSAAAVYPGGIPTELGRHMDRSHIQAMIGQMDKQLCNSGQVFFPVEDDPLGNCNFGMGRCCCFG